MSKTASEWTNRWPRKVGYYWMWSPDLDGVFIVEVSGGAKDVAVVFYLGGEGPAARSLIEQQYGHSCEFIGPLKRPVHD